LSLASYFGGLKYIHFTKTTLLEENEILVTEFLCFCELYSDSLMGRYSFMYVTVKAEKCFCSHWLLI